PSYRSGSCRLAKKAVLNPNHDGALAAPRFCTSNDPTWFQLTCLKRLFGKGRHRRRRGEPARGRG
ncbi:MAG: hypothetical protein ACK6DS_02355, partial [Planctomycetota bacterium]